jgi:hypothetical protein
VTIRDLVRDYVLADGTVAGLIGTRLYPDMLPQKCTYPAGVIQAIDIVRPNTLRGVASLARARIQIDVYAQPTSGSSSRSAADAAGTAIRQRLDGFAGLLDTVQAWVMFDLETEGAEPEIHGGLSRHTADYLVNYQTQAGAY